VRRGALAEHWPPLPRVESARRRLFLDSTPNLSPHKPTNFPLLPKLRRRQLSGKFRFDLGANRGNGNLATVRDDSIFFRHPAILPAEQQRHTTLAESPAGGVIGGDAGA